MLTAIHTQLDRKEAVKKAQAMADKLDQMKLRKAADKVCNGKWENDKKTRRR